MGMMYTDEGGGGLTEGLTGGLGRGLGGGRPGDFSPAVRMEYVYGGSQGLDSTFESGACVCFCLRVCPLVTPNIVVVITTPS